MQVLGNKSYEIIGKWSAHGQGEKWNDDLIKTLLNNKR